MALPPVVERLVLHWGEMGSLWNVNRSVSQIHALLYFSEKPLPADEAQLKSRIMQRILVNDAEIRQLAEPWLEDLDDILAGRPKTLH